MAQHSNVTIPAATWTMITSSDVTSLRIQNIGTFASDIQATTGQVAPTSNAGAINLDAGQVIPADLTLADLFPGVSNGVRVWAYSDNETTLSVSHA